MRLAWMFSLAIMALGSGSPAAHAADACEKKCYKAKTCAFVGPQCLEFDWCIDPCKGKSAAPDEKAAPAPPGNSSKEPLPGPKEI